MCLFQRLEFVAIPEQTSHALFQLTGALRNIASEDGLFPQFASGGAVFELCRSMQLFSADLDLISNIARTLRWVLLNLYPWFSMAWHENEVS